MFFIIVQGSQYYHLLPTCMTSDLQFFHLYQVCLRKKLSCQRCSMGSKHFIFASILFLYIRNIISSIKPLPYYSISRKKSYYLRILKPIYRHKSTYSSFLTFPYSKPYCYMISVSAMVNFSTLLAIFHKYFAT